jgi:cell shape-determining protein MreC
MRAIDEYWERFERKGKSMKKIILVLLVMVMLSGCNIIEENKSLKAKNQELDQRVKEVDQRVKELGQRVKELDQKVNELDQKALERQQEISRLKQDQSSSDESSLKACLDEAKARLERNLKLNDTEHQKGSDTMPTRVVQHIQNLYRDECEECYRKYGPK